MSELGAKIAVIHSPVWWVVTAAYPGVVGLTGIGVAVAAIPIALAQRQPLFLLMLLLAVPGFQLIRPARSALIASRHQPTVVVEPDRAIIVMPGVLPEPLVVPRRYVDSVWSTTSLAAPPRRGVPILSGVYALEGRRISRPMLLVVTNTLLDTGKIPAFGLRLLVGSGPRRHVLLRGIMIPVYDLDVALAAFADWPNRFGDPPGDIQRWLKGPSWASRLRFLLRPPPGREIVLLESEPDFRVLPRGKAP